MKPETFVKEIIEVIIQDNIEIYKDIFETTNLSDVTDEYWKQAIPFYKSLTDEKKQVLFKIIRQVQVDTLSNVLSILDGKTFLENQEEDLELKYKGVLLNNDLQDIFLEIEEGS